MLQILWTQNKFYYLVKDQVVEADIKARPKIPKEGAVIAILSQDVRRELLERIKRVEEIESRLMAKNVFKIGQIVTYEKSRNDIYTAYVLPEEVFSDISETIPKVVKIFPYEALLKRFLKKEIDKRKGKAIVWLETYSRDVKVNPEIYLTVVYDEGEGVSKTYTMTRTDEVRRYIDNAIRSVKAPEAYVLLSNSRALIERLREDGSVSEQDSEVLPFEVPFAACLQSYTQVAPIPPEFRSPEEAVKKKQQARHARAFLTLLLGGVLIAAGLGVMAVTKAQKSILSSKAAKLKEEVKILEDTLQKDYYAKFPTLVEDKTIAARFRLARGVVTLIKKLPNKLEIRKVEIMGPPTHPIHIYLIVKEGITVENLKKLIPIKNLEVKSAIVDNEPGFHLTL